MTKAPHIILSLVALVAASSAMAANADIASYAFTPEIRLLSDVRTRGTSDSLLKPAVRFSTQFAHESGMVALLEITSISKRQFQGGSGLTATLGGGYRFGDPEAWHFGAGAAVELFPGASYEAPHGIDLPTLTPTDVRRTKFDSTAAVFEAGYGNLETRLVYILSKTYRGIGTGGVCGTLLSLNPDPTVGLNCYGRGDRGSRGSLLFDIGYKIPLDSSTTLNLHAGYQKVRNFKEANLADWSIGVTHKRWGFEFTAEWLGSNAKARELYLVQDGDRLRATDNSKVVLSVAHKF